MIKLENKEVMGWEAAIRGMRNPKNSWEKSDSGWDAHIPPLELRNQVDWKRWAEHYKAVQYSDEYTYDIGPNDRDLMARLRNAGTDHRKFMRMITVYVDITAPLYWWKEFDTYKVGTVANSCSTMHKIADKEFTLEDFSCEHLFDVKDMISSDQHNENSINKDIALAAVNVDGNDCYFTPKGFIQMTCNILNRYRNRFLETKDKRYWWQMIQLLPSSYNQRRTVMLNYEVLANMYKSRKNHKLDEWHVLCDWIESLPYGQLITGAFDAKEEK